MRKILLTLLAAASTLGASAITIDDLCGSYQEARTTISNSFTVYFNDITIEQKNENTIVINNFYSAECPVEGVVDLEAMTVSFAEQVLFIHESGLPYYLRNNAGGTADKEPVIGYIKEDEGTLTITIGTEELYAGANVEIPNGPSLFLSGEMQYTFTKMPDVQPLAIGDLVGSYQEARTTISNSYTVYFDDVTIEQKDDNTIVINNFYSAECPVEGVVDLEAMTVSFAEQVLFIHESGLPYYLRNNAGGTADKEPVIGYIEQNDSTLTITIGTEELYAGANVEIPNGPSLFFSGEMQYTFTKTSDDTGIHNVTTPASDKLDPNAPIYNICGQRVGKKAKGLLIQNGKKFYVR